MSWIWWIVAVVSGLLILGGLGMAYSQHRWLKRAVFVPGTVCKLVPRKGEGQVTYSPRIRYTAPDGQSREFDASFSGNPSPYEVGELLPVACDPATTRASIATFGASFGPPLVMACLGVGGLLLAVAFLLGPRWVPGAYLPPGFKLEAPPPDAPGDVVKNE